MDNLSICVVAYNRNVCTFREKKIVIFPRCVKSIFDTLKSMPNIEAELIVGGPPSTDWPLQVWLPKAMGSTHCTIVNTPEGLSPGGAFIKGKCLNPAVEAAKYENLLLIECDFLIVPELIKRTLHWLKQGYTFFPYYLRGNIHGENCVWRRGCGNMAITKTAYNLIGGWPEDLYRRGCDNYILEEIGRRALPFVREQVEGLKHIWHPPSLGFSKAMQQQTRDNQKAFAEMCGKVQTIKNKLIEEDNKWKTQSTDLS